MTGFLVSSKEAKDFIKKHHIAPHSSGDMEDQGGYTSFSDALEGNRASLE